MKKPPVLAEANIIHTADFILKQSLAVLQDAFIILSRNNRIVFLNKAGEKLFSQDGKQTLQEGDELTYFFHNEDTFRELIDRAFCNDPEQISVQLSQQNKESWLQIDFRPVADRDGIITNICIVAKDITDKVKLQDQIMVADQKGREEERLQIARELQENLSQMLVAAKLYNETCLKDEVLNKELLNMSIVYLNHSIDEVKNFSRRLSSIKIMEGFDLVLSLKELIDSINRSGKLIVSFYNYGLNNKKLPQEIEATLFRVAEEHLHQIIEQGIGGMTELAIVGTSVGVSLRIQDDRNEPDPVQKSKDRSMINMITRVEALNGEIRLERVAGKGTVLLVEFPI
jgi:PAS domain S-box-containing protein